MTEKHKHLLLVIGFSIGVSLITNLFLGTKTETEVWKKTSIEAIFTIGQLNETDKIKARTLHTMADELKALGNDEVNVILNRYLLNTQKK